MVDEHPDDARRTVGAVDATRLLGDLDPEQRAAVTTPSTLVAVIAAAGSGKTRVLARRIAYRVATGTADARHTLALTFTRQAAGELRRRLRDSGLREPIEAGTFHSVALGVMRQRWADERRPVPNIVNDRNRLIAAVGREMPVDTIATERSWCAARGVEPDGVRRRGASRRTAAAPCHRPPSPRSSPTTRRSSAIAASSTSTICCCCSPRAGG